MEEDQTEQKEFRTCILSWVKHQQRKNQEGEETPPSFKNNSESTPPFMKNSGKSGENVHYAAKKIKLLEFFGFDPRGWIAKA